MFIITKIIIDINKLVLLENLKSLTLSYNCLIIHVVQLILGLNILH